MEKNKEFYYNRGISEGYYRVHLLNDVINQSKEIREAYITGFGYGQHLRSTLNPTQNEQAEENRIEFIKYVGFEVGCYGLAASSDNLKTAEELEAFKEGLEAGDYTKKIQDLVKERSKGSSR